jgi:hypothetical protein
MRQEILDREGEELDENTDNRSDLFFKIWEGLKQNRTRDGDMKTGLEIFSVK